VKNTFILILFVSIFCLASCTPHKNSPIDSRPAPPSNKIKQHIVSPNETLFAIAWKYELNYKKLAQVNKLNSSYTIYPGQRLTLDTSGYRKSITQATVKKPVSKKVSKAKTTNKTTAPAKSKTISKPVQGDTASKLATVPNTWRWKWPVNGRVVKKYDSARQLKGIYIYAKKGMSVKAAGPGVVVYAGSGLRGYGNLIIIKHSNIYLSAYAHNRKILIKEGAVVKVGQVIAEVGGDPEDVNRFYFGLRKDGKNVDPLRYLPPK